MPFGSRRQSNLSGSGTLLRAAGGRPGPQAGAVSAESRAVSRAGTQQRPGEVWSGGHLSLRRRRRRPRRLMTNEHSRTSATCPGLVAGVLAPLPPFPPAPTPPSYLLLVSAPGRGGFGVGPEHATSPHVPQPASPAPVSPRRRRRAGSRSTARWARRAGRRVGRCTNKCSGRAIRRVL